MTKNAYDNIIAGALLKLGKVDVIDEYLIVSELLPKLGEDKYACRGGMVDIWRFLQEKDNCLVLRDNFTFDSVIDWDYVKNSSFCWYTMKDYYVEGNTLKELFERFAGTEIMEYINNFNADDFYQKKEEFLEKQKTLLLQDANVLLLSEVGKEYEQLQSYGFKKIDRFKSIIRADKYFKSHPEELKKYHIIIDGSTPFRSRDQLASLKGSFRQNKKIVYCSYIKCNINNSPIDSYDASFYLDETLRKFAVLDRDFNKVIDAVIYFGAIKDVLNRIDKKYISKHPIENIDATNKITLPDQKKQLKILYVNRYYGAFSPAIKIAEDLGLNVEFRYRGDNYVEDKYGDYDIILGGSFTGVTIDEKQEVAEQCKDTGRRLVLVANFEEHSLSVKDENGDSEYDRFGNEMELKYIYAGELGDDEKPSNKRFRILKDGDINLNECNLKATLEDAVRLYNDRLIKMTGKGLSDFDFKTSEEYDSEYDLVAKNEQARVDKILKPIRDFESMNYTINRILAYKDWITEEEQEILNDFNIIDRDDGLITVEVKENGKVISRITCLKTYKQETYREFIFSYGDDTHTIEDKQRLGLYTSKHEGEKFLPRRANKKELEQLEIMESIIQQKLSPITHNAWNRKFSYECKRDSEDSEARTKIFFFDSDLREPVKRYLEFRHNHLVPDRIEGLNISNDKENISVSLEYDGRILGGITFKKRYAYGYIRDFSVSYLTSKGKLQNSGTVGYCTHEHDDIKASLNKPDEKSEDIIKKIKKKVDTLISPLNGDAYRYLEGIQTEIPGLGRPLIKTRRN